MLHISGPYFLDVQRCSWHSGQTINIFIYHTDCLTIGRSCGLGDKANEEDSGKRAYSTEDASKRNQIRGKLRPVRIIRLRQRRKNH